MLQHLAVHRRRFILLVYDGVPVSGVCGGQAISMHSRRVGSHQVAEDTVPCRRKGSDVLGDIGAHDSTNMFIFHWQTGRISKGHQVVYIMNMYLLFFRHISIYIDITCIVLKIPFLVPE